MQLSQLALLAVRGSKTIVPQLADALEVSVSTVYRYISSNSDELTKAAALNIIREVTGLEDSQILEPAKISA